MRHVAEKLKSTDQKLDMAHKAIQEKASSSHYIYYLTCFLLGGIIVYALSVVYRSFHKNESKKFI
jgi:hypothetical protein